MGPRKGAPACWLILGMGEDRSASCKGMLKSILDLAADASCSIHC